MGRKVGTAAVALNIKNEETERLSRALAARTGESLTTAITVALRERLGRLDQSGGEALAQVALIRALAREIAPALEASPITIEGLYDENGLPA